ncbi:signal transduction histidine kinase/CheY-like chemotaxis protein [Saonia flava]|uniref:histidine kinase n=1 Tax=Saonia flava TaxID=523696 RepID=A0A846QVZ4_9FLAO|nr:hybrid sensor histidine kinase/response regulator [Saonia flava]NJB71100.1 signal transduction histidine kinase/CheY-like chemotaxis protein [Saonia flava]
MLLNKEIVLKRLLALSFFLSILISVNGQVVIDKTSQETFSIRPYAYLFNAGDEQYDFEYIQSNSEKLSFKPLTAFKENLGFSQDNLWIQFGIHNDTEKPMHFYLETGRPITDYVTLYTTNENGEAMVHKSGDVIPYNEKSVQHRKSVFRLELGANEELKGWIHLKSDGEVAVLPLDLYSQKDFIEKTYQEQIFYGFFYGILILACIIYGFFYFALRDKVFIFYGLYVLFIAMLQFSLDGFFHQYFTPQGGWLSNRAVIISALTSLLFFVKYGETFLDIKQHSKVLYLSHRVMLISIIACISILLLVPSSLPVAYPLANAVGLLVLFQMITSIVVLKRKKVKVDTYFVGGISFLIMGFIVFILNNFNLISSSFFTSNGAKFGIGLEIIFLSISMSNRIRTLRVENDKNQILALQRAKDMNEIKSSFISNISHELRTPLNLIMGVASSLKENREDMDLDEKCGLILNSSESLLGYIEDILDFTVIEKGNQELKEISFNLHDTINKITSVNAEKAKNKELDFIYSDISNLPKRIIGDRVKLVQILNNLLDNAIKFTESGTIELHIGHTIEKGNKIHLDFSISDTGIGISKEKMSTIFESFTKKSFLDKREFSGLGLGLYIVKNYVDLQKGHISIHNNYQKGITCKVSLVFPLDENELQKDILESSLSGQYNLKGCNILLAEDNKTNQTVIKLLAKKWENTTLTIANNGSEAIGFIKENTYDIVLMDLQMPVMDGFETTAMIRSGKISNVDMDIPIIVLTADSTDKTKKEIFRLGANDYMTKPINGNLLYKKIENNLVLTPK